MLILKSFIYIINHDMFFKDNLGLYKFSVMDCQHIYVQMHAFDFTVLCYVGKTLIKYYHI